jgi:hypothetical protein
VTVDEAFDVLAGRPGRDRSLAVCVLVDAVDGRWDIDAERELAAEWLLNSGVPQPDVDEILELAIY